MTAIALYQDDHLTKIIPSSAIRTLVFPPENPKQLVIHLLGGASMEPPSPPSLVASHPAYGYSFTSRVNYTVIEALEPLDQEAVLRFFCGESGQNRLAIHCRYIS